MTQFVRQKNQQLRGFSLSPKPLMHENYDAMLVEPFFYLWPLIFQILDPDLVHLNVGWGIQALALSPFIPDRRRTVVDFYEVLSFLSDAYFEKTHSSAEEVRMGEAHFVKNYDHVMHLCSDEISTRLEEKYDTHGSIVSVTEYLEEPTYCVPPRDDGVIRLVYGGCMLATTNPDDLYYKAFMKVVPHYARENLHLYIYNSPYVHGIVENDGLKEVLQKLGLTNVHACMPLRLDDFARKISEYDYGITLLRPKDMEAAEYQYFMATKVLTYLRAGLPVVIDADNRFMASLVSRYQIGVVLQDYDLENVPDILNNVDLTSLKRNVVKFRSEFSIEKGGAKVLDIYRNILDQSGRKHVFPVTEKAPSAPKAVDHDMDFNKLITSMADAENRLYYRDQSAQTMSSLARHARELDPSVIVELGTLAGLSLRTWIASAAQAKIYAVDLSFATLHETLRFLPADLARVTLLEQDILKTDFPSLWTAQDKVIFFVDAHDLPGVPIMEHVLTNVLPALPDGSLVMVDDLWFSEERLTGDNAGSFLRNRVVGEIDELQCFEGHYAPYHEGGSFMGFAEVIPLLKFANAHGIPLVHEEGGKHVSFVWKRAYLSHRRAVDSAEPVDCCGSVLHNPLTSIPVSPPLRDTMRRIATDYQQKKIAQAAQSLAGLIEQYPHDPGPAYGLAVCFARRGKLSQARDILGRIVQNSDDPRCRRLFDDLVARVGPCPSQGLGVPAPRSQGPGVPGPRSQGPGVTIFAMPKSFVGHVATIQKNAIRSWARLDPAPEIILFGDEAGVQEMAQEVGARHIPDVDRNEFGTPLVNKLFEAAQTHASHTIVAYVNADMILFQDFVGAVQTVQTRFSEFLLIGRRWDLTFLDEIEFAPGWQQLLRRQATEEGILHAECGLDYFVFPKGVYPEIPPFAIGRTAWDNWLVRAPRKNGVPVVDGTEAVVAVHQDHDYGHVAGGRDEAWHGVEAARNRSLAGEADGWGYTTGAAWALNEACQLVEVQPRRPEFGSAAYRARRSNWLAKQARRLMAFDALELAACRWEESLMFLDKLMEGRQPEHVNSAPLDDGGMTESYKAGCALLAQCYMKLERHDRVVATYTRLLGASCVYLPEEQRAEIIRVRDQFQEHLSSGSEPLACPKVVPKTPPVAPKTSGLPRRCPDKQSRSDGRRIALIVSIPERPEGLRKVVRSIETQVDEIRILLNEFEVAPEDLYACKKVSLIETSRTGELFASGIWNLLQPEDEGYVLVLDDDIEYPADYAERMIAKIEEHQRRAVVAVHGIEFCAPFADYIWDRTLYHYEEAHGQDCVVHASGVGTSVFHTSTLRPQVQDFPDPTFRGLWFAVLAARQKVPIVCLARGQHWLRPIETHGKQLWRIAHQQEWRNRENETFRKNLLPLLGVQEPQGPITKSDFTVFSFTNGRSTFKYSARSLVDSWDWQEQIVVLRGLDFLDAASKCLASCETPYFFKIDDDFILHPKALAYMRKRVLEYPHPEELGIYYCHLWEDWTSRVRQSIKVYRTEALRKIGGFKANDQGKVDETTKAALEQAGYKVVKDPSVVALHACGSWQEQLEYERRWSSMAARPYQKPTHNAMKDYCGTKSLDEQYAMRLGVLEYANQQLNTPFHGFLVEEPTPIPGALRLSMPTPKSGQDGGRTSRSVAGHTVGSGTASDVSRDGVNSPSVPDRQPRVSVITACRNVEAYLPECLDSILAQTMPEWELFLLDDGSTDGTRRIMQDYARRDGRIKPFFFDDSTGPYIRRNAAIQRARSPFVMIQDADDIMVPNKLQALYDAISRDDRLGVVGSFYRKFLDTFRGIKYTEPVALLTTHEQILEIYQTQNLWDFSWHGSAIIRRSLFDEIGLYDENPFGADSFWLAKAAEYARHTGKMRLSNTPEFLTLRRMHDDSQTGALLPIDPRGRRARYWQYCLGKLQQLAKQVQQDPHLDVARALRECTCSDFLTRFRAQIITWEGQSLDDRVVPYALRNAVARFNDGHYVSCVRALREVETMAPATPSRVVHFNLLRAMALLGLGLKEQALVHVDCELDRHNSSAARQFHEDYFQRGLQRDVQQWCAENAERYNLGLIESRPGESPVSKRDIGAGQKRQTAL